MNSKIESLISFLHKSPTAYHAVEQLRTHLLNANFKELKENESWELNPNCRYFLIKRDSSLLAFITPEQFPLGFKIVGTHSDSPGFRLKPKSECIRGNYVMLGVEIYGSPLLSSWLNRDLGIAGRTTLRSENGSLVSKLINLPQYPVTIPQLAIHLDREVNEKGLNLNKQEHLFAIAALTDESTTQKPILEALLNEEIETDNLLGLDLFLYPLDPPRLLGAHHSMLASYRLDNLASTYGCFEGFLEAAQKTHDSICVFTSWDHEEVGSHSFQGAQSPFLPQTLERIILELKGDRKDYFRLLSNSFCLSCDLAHAFHPGYPEKFESQHPILLNQGIVIKTNAQQRYATDGSTTAVVADLCRQHHIPYQHLVNRNDIPCGSTIGPITASLTGIPTVDIGIPQLSMHSCRELIGTQDYLYMIDLTREFFNPSTRTNF